MDACQMHVFYTWLACSGGLNCIPTHQCFDREMEIEGAYVLSPLRRVYNYTRGHQSTTRSTDRWGCHYGASY
ncbi:hypothetical protein Goklo_013981 [Gossypium klotzschianum]|uniref:Uncharacterized protein n=1 Tax=Gossypium klotzschianum TaxID=34286 RepID=A0A7J8U6C2_9ROSI|nr:hypothetical protein [Gossypium klotzschianum]